MNAGSFAREDGSDPSRRTVLVLGMHRSGTSVLTQVLALLGCHLGKEEDLLPAHPTDNPTGYAERADVVAAHDRFLHSAGFGWNRLAAFDLDRFDERAKQELLGALRGIHADIGPTGGPVAIKDPRLCLVLPLWRLLLSSPVYVVAVRDPREVACSLADGPRGVYPTPHALALWETYIRNMLAGMRYQRALFVSFPNLLNDPMVEAERLKLGLRALGIDGLSNVPEAELRALVDPGLRRSLPAAPMSLTPAQEALYRWLDAKSRLPTPGLVDDFPWAPLPDAVLSEYEKGAGAEAQPDPVDLVEPMM